MELPSELDAAIVAELDSASVKSLAKPAAELSRRYRAGNAQPAGGRFLHTHDDVAAYAAFRLPATFAAVRAALAQVQDRLLTWSPRSVLDVGAGPATATWATADLWPNLERATLFEREEAMIELGRRLAAFSSTAAVRGADWRKVDITGGWDVGQHDLVIISYTLGELPEERCAPLIRRLWDATAGVLVIIEPGSATGFRRVREARQQLLDAGATVVAPCPHSQACPIPADDWCHFAQRLTRSPLHRRVKAGELPYEDEKYSYICLSRLSGQAIEGRVTRHPQARPGHVHLRLCTADGLTTRTVTRKDRELYRLARDLKWGSVMPRGREAEEN